MKYIDLSDKEITKLYPTTTWYNIVLKCQKEHKLAEDFYNKPEAVLHGKLKELYPKETKELEASIKRTNELKDYAKSWNIPIHIQPSDIIASLIDLDNVAKMSEKDMFDVLMTSPISTNRRALTYITMILSNASYKEARKNFCKEYIDYMNINKERLIKFIATHPQTDNFEIGKIAFYKVGDAVVGTIKKIRDKVIDLETSGSDKLKENKGNIYVY